MRVKHGIVMVAGGVIFLDTLRSFPRLCHLLWKCPRATAEGIGLYGYVHIR